MSMGVRFSYAAKLAVPRVASSDVFTHRKEPKANFIPLFSWFIGYLRFTRQFEEQLP
jgi:hypothetical protein